MLDESLIADKIFEPEAKRKAQEKIARVALNCPVLDWWHLANAAIWLLSLLQCQRLTFY
jgi:hypothetical protein